MDGPRSFRGVCQRCRSTTCTTPAHLAIIRSHRLLAVVAQPAAGARTGSIFRPASGGLTQRRTIGSPAMACTRLQGKVAVVTASTEGIGFAIAERLCAEGASVMISSRKQQNVDEAVAALQAKVGFDTADNCLLTLIST